jgi:hypothetical protein
VRRQLAGQDARVDVVAVLAEGSGAGVAPWPDVHIIFSVVNVTLDVDVRRITIAPDGNWYHVAASALH